MENASAIDPIIVKKYLLFWYTNYRLQKGNIILILDKMRIYIVVTGKQFLPPKRIITIHNGECEPLLIWLQFTSHISVE